MHRNALLLSGVLISLLLASCNREPDTHIAEKRPPVTKAGQQSESFVIRYVYDITTTAPFQMGKGTSIPETSPGVNIELLRLVEKQTGIPIRYKRVPWNRGLHLVKTGNADAIFQSAYNIDRTEYAVYPMTNGQPDVSRRLSTQTTCLYKLESSPLSWDGKQMKSLNGVIGVNRGFGIAKKLKRMGVEVDDSANTETNLDKLLKKRVAGYAQLETKADLVIRKDINKYGSIQKVSPPLQTIDFFVMFSKRFYESHPEAAEEVWKAIRDIRATDDYRRLMEKYSGLLQK